LSAQKKRCFELSALDRECDETVAELVRGIADDVRDMITGSEEITQYERMPRACAPIPDISAGSLVSGLPGSVQNMTNAATRIVYWAAELDGLK
jgi:hypothetical protein